VRLGAIFPQTEIGNDPGAIADFARAAEAAGYDHLLAFDHVLGAVPRPGWRGPYTVEHPFHEPFVLFGFLAGLTRRLELTTGIVILPQRQTALVAKQAAEVDVLSGGRLRLGVGIGWNEVEYEALGMDFHTRGRRMAEQVRVLRLLWTQEVVTFQGRWHRITQAGINPLPVQRPIPLWMGGHAEPALRRAARLADGWMAGGTLRTSTVQGPPANLETYRGIVERLRVLVREAGRDPAAFGIEGRIAYQVGPDGWRTGYEAWRALGGTHLSVTTMGAGLDTPAKHVQAIQDVAAALRG
jgi:probable F420-dependent oxidoreductase